VWRKPEGAVVVFGLLKMVTVSNNSAILGELELILRLKEISKRRTNVRIYWDKFYGLFVF
jgi:hypothetical protein